MLYLNMGNGKEIRQVDQEECEGFPWTSHFLGGRIHVSLALVFPHLAQIQTEL